MSVVKCKYCHVRIPPRQLPLHLKRCVNYRRMLKAGQVDSETAELNKTIAGSIEFHTSSPKLTKAQIKAAKNSNGNKTSGSKVQNGKKAQR